MPFTFKVFNTINKRKFQRSFLTAGKISSINALRTLSSKHNTVIHKDPNQIWPISTLHAVLYKRGITKDFMNPQESSSCRRCSF